MHAIHVSVHVKPEFVQAFIEATLENARHSLREAGVARFDFMQRTDDPARFVLNEVYRTVDAAAAHKLTTHYLKWLDTVTEMMAEPRQRVTLTNLFPSDEDF
jgi:(4S)-4-hydroxy-5-phosphonooxypentane-2,3-dione isomerase